MEINSGYIKPDQVWEEVREIVVLFNRFQIDDLIVFYGFGCGCEIDELYQDIEIKTNTLLAFLSESIAKGYYHIAAADFYIQSRSVGVEFLLCHESDVHLETENVEVADSIKARWAANDYPCYEKLSGDWVSLQGTQAVEARV